ncbi:unnamed protein product [Effrenium voratum]|nr:unnamed protein product [Effrenium voratum]
MAPASKSTGQEDSGWCYEETDSEVVDEHRETLLNELQLARLEEPSTIDGLRDWVLDAAPLVDELFQALTAKSSGLQRFRAVIAEAARNLNEELWQEFWRRPLSTTHREDKLVFSRLLADAEPLWRKLMGTEDRMFSKKRSAQGEIKEYLYIGTKRPSREMVEFFREKGWRIRVQPPVSPKPLDPQAGEDGHPGSQLVIVDLTFPPAGQECPEDQLTNDTDLEEPSELPSDALDEMPDVQEESRTSSHASEAPRSKSSKSSQLPDPMEGLESFDAPMVNLPLHCSGFGKIGMSRSEGVRRRLQAVQAALAQGLRCLAPGGAFVVSWSGLPVHPLVPFVASKLRPGFLRLHVLAPPGEKTFETYFLGVEYNYEGHPSRPDPVQEYPPPPNSGIGGTEPADISKFDFLTWLRSPLRSWCSGYDDALAWTISQTHKLEEECLPKYQESETAPRLDAAYDRPWLTQPGDAKKARSGPLDSEARCDEMWSIYSEKLRLLADSILEDCIRPSVLPDKPPYRTNATTRWDLAAARGPLDPHMMRSSSKAPRKASKEPRSKSKSSKGKAESAAPTPSPASPASPAAPTASPAWPASPASPASPLVETAPEVPRERPEEAAAGKAEEAPAAGAAAEAAPAAGAAAEAAPAAGAVAGEPPAAGAVAEAATAAGAAAEPASGRGAAKPAFARASKEKKQPEWWQPPRVRPAPLAGRKQDTMWMSSTLGGAPGIGPDFMALVKRSPLLGGALEKLMQVDDRKVLPDLYRAAWPSPESSPYQARRPMSKSSSRPRSAASSALLSEPRQSPGHSKQPPGLERSASLPRPNSTSSRRRVDALAGPVPTETRPHSAAHLGPKKGRKGKR